MKPRLKAAPITDEDYDIWWIRVKWGDRHHYIGAFGNVYIEADRRDAALMYSMVGLSEEWSIAARHELLAYHFGGGPVP